MHTHNDTRTRDNTLALYGARHHSTAYLALRGLARTALVIAVVVIPHAIAYAIVPA
jgi:hypothetical protein